MNRALLDELPLETIRRIDALCDAYEQSLLNGEPAELVKLLQGWEGAERDLLLRELICTDQAIRIPPWCFEDFRRVLPGDEATIRAALADADGNRHARDLVVRCPHCHQSLGVAADHPFSNITCDACGSTFSVLGEDTLTEQVDAKQALGHFTLLNRLGVGAFGSVWRARDQKLDRTVAIKIPRVKELSSEEEEQFLREARAAAQLRHPNIVSVHEVGRDGDTLYIVSDYVQGVSLSDWLDGQQPTAREAARMCRKIAQALDYAHEMGVIHRDLKPSNIIVDVAGEPHLMDFGLARREIGELTVTADGQLLGTPGYMSPEQAEGAAHTADRRSDVYSLGVVLFRMLTGELPFRGSAHMQIQQKLTDDAPSLRRLHGSTPADLETVTLKCLERTPERRYPTASAVAAELDRYLEGRPIEARPYGRLERMRRWVDRNRTVSTLSFALLAVLIGASCISTILAVRANVALSKEKQARRDAESSKELAAQREESALRSLYIARMNNAWKAASELEYRDAQGILRLCKPSREGSDFRGFEWYHIRKKCEPLERVLPGHSQHLSTTCSLAVSPDGRILAAGGMKRIQLYNVENWECVAELEGHAGFIRELSFHPNGRFLASACEDGSVNIWDCRTFKLQRSLTGHVGQIATVVYSHNGRWLASAGKGGTIRLWEATTGKQLENWQAHEEIISCIRFSEDDDRLVSAGTDGMVRIWNVPHGEFIREVKSGMAETWSVALLDKKNQLFVSGSAHEIEVYELPKLKLKGRIPGHEFNVASLALSIDETRLVTIGKDRTILVWDVEQEKWLSRFKDFQALRSICITPDAERVISGNVGGSITVWGIPRIRARSAANTNHGLLIDIEFSHDGTLVATSGRDGLIKLWDATTASEIRQFRGHQSAVIQICFSSDDRKIVSAGRDGTARIWDVQSGSILGVLTKHDGMVRSVAYSPRDELIATSGNDGLVIVWDAALQTVIKTLNGHQGKPVGSVAFSPDGTLLASGSDDSHVNLWSTNTWNLTNSWLATAPLSYIEFAPNGRLLATCGFPSGALASPNEIVVWKVPNGDRVRNVRGHTAQTPRVAWSHDSRTLAGASFSGIVRLWDVETGENRFNFDRFPVEAASSSFSPDGTAFALGAGNGLYILRATLDE